MADVRALLAAERQSRRITHPHLTYTKTGALICNICNLNVKSESLWEGHLRSANHRKNVTASQAAKEAILSQNNTTKLKKRKIEDVEDAEREDEPPSDEHDTPNQRDDVVAGRKKNKSRSESLAETEQGQPLINKQSQPHSPLPSTVPPVPSTTHPQPPPKAEEIDEDEWAAFTSEIAPLTFTNDTTTQPASSTTYSATISAPAISSAQLAAQQKSDEETQKSQRKRREEEAEEEREDEGRRLEEEMEVMEEMEGKVRRLRELREAIRLGRGTGAGDVGEGGQSEELQEGTKLDKENEEEDEEDEDEDEVDDWYS